MLKTHFKYYIPSLETIDENESLSFILNKNKDKYSLLIEKILNKHYTNFDNISRVGEQISFKIFNNDIKSLNINNLELSKFKIESEWFLSSETNIQILKDNNINSRNTKNVNCDIGISHCYHLKHYGNENNVNQILYILNKIKNFPYSRNLIMNIWHPEHLGKYNPCMYSYQFLITNEKYINLIVIQQSCDIINSLPLNLLMAGYILKYFCDKTTYKMKKIIFQFGDIHIYYKDINK